MLLESSHTALGVLFLILVTTTVTDLSSHRIPNVVSLGGALVGLSLQTWALGLDGLLSGIGGLAVGMALFLPFYALKGMGAGDVKLMAAVGVFLGPTNVLLAGGLSLMTGFILALCMLTLHGGLAATMHRYLFLACSLPATRSLKMSYVAPQAGEAATKRFPYAAAITLGTVAALWWLSLLHPVFQTLDGV